MADKSEWDFVNNPEDKLFLLEETRAGMKFENWTQGSTGKTLCGEEVTWSEPDAVQFCGLGHVLRTWHKLEGCELAVYSSDRINKVIPNWGYLTVLNDDPQHSEGECFANVCEWFDEEITKLKAQINLQQKAN